MLTCVPRQVKPQQGKGSSAELERVHSRFACLCTGFTEEMGVSKHCPASHAPLPGLHPSINCIGPVSPLLFPCSDALCLAFQISEALSGQPGAGTSLIYSARLNETQAFQGVPLQIPPSAVKLPHACSAAAPREQRYQANTKLPSMFLLARWCCSTLCSEHRTADDGRACTRAELWPLHSSTRLPGWDA